MCKIEVRELRIRNRYLDDAFVLIQGPIRYCFSKLYFDSLILFNTLLYSPEIFLL